jgi:hypothetical protein
MDAMKTADWPKSQALRCTGPEAAIFGGFPLGNFFRSRSHNKSGPSSGVPGLTSENESMNDQNDEI